MNANLKELMRGAGYPATEGANWGAADTKTFQGFAVRELGVPFSQTSSMLAYPEAFPVALNRLSAMTGVLPEPAAAPIVPQTVAEAVQEMIPAEPMIPATAPVNEPIDLSAPNQLPKQELEQPATDTAADQGAADEGGTEDGAADESEGEGDEEPPEDSGSDEDGDTEGADDEENTEGPDATEGDKAAEDDAADKE